ncbi:MAG TPA: ABC transporter permease, partial [Halomonas sp.]|nr:ABC transporter permease [Halomonas sp.]
MSLLDALPTQRLRWEGRHPNVVLISLSLVMLFAFWTFDVVSMAPNRIVVGTSYGALEAFGWPGVLLITLLLSSIGLFAWQPTIPHYRALLAAVVALMALMPVGLIASRFLLI